MHSVIVVERVQESWNYVGEINIHRHSKIVNSKLSMTSIISGRLNWVIRIIIMKQGHWFRTSFDIMFKESTIKAFICMARALETMVRLCSSKARTCSWISGIDWINYQARVDTRHELSFCPTVVCEKKKLVASNFASAHNSVMVE